MRVQCVQPSAGALGITALPLQSQQEKLCRDCLQPLTWAFSFSHTAPLDTIRRLFRVLSESGFSISLSGSPHSTGISDLRLMILLLDDCGLSTLLSLLLLLIVTFIIDTIMIYTSCYCHYNNQSDWLNTMCKNVPDTSPHFFFLLQYPLYVVLYILLYMLYWTYCSFIICIMKLCHESGLFLCGTLLTT